MYLIQGIPWFTQPWGGAAAFDRSTFQKLGVAGFWARNVVDDISLAKLLKKGGIKALLVPTVWLTTPLHHETLAGWGQWFSRQLFYLKISLTGSWVLAGIVCYHLATMVVLAAVGAIAGLVGWVPVSNMLVSLGFMMVLGGVGMTLRIFHPNPGPCWIWFLAAFITPLIAAWAHAKIVFVQEICWRGITYRVTWQGKVMEIKENSQELREPSGHINGSTYSSSAMQSTPHLNQLVLCQLHCYRPAPSVVPRSDAGDSGNLGFRMKRI
jgi:hypothetical protein